MYKDLSLIYESIGSLAAPEINPKLSIRNNKLGIQVADMAAASMAGNVPFGNPQEQEETVDSAIKKSQVLGEIENLLKGLGSSPTDRVAVLALSNLKKKISKL